MEAKYEALKLQKGRPFLPGVRGGAGGFSLSSPGPARPIIYPPRDLALSKRQRPDSAISNLPAVRRKISVSERELGAEGMRQHNRSAGGLGLTAHARIGVPSGRSTEYKGGTPLPPRSSALQLLPARPAGGENVRRMTEISIPMHKSGWQASQPHPLSFQADDGQRPDVQQTGNSLRTMSRPYEPVRPYEPPRPYGPAQSFDPARPPLVTVQPGNQTMMPPPIYSHQMPPPHGNGMPPGMPAYPIHFASRLRSAPEFPISPV